MNERGQLWHLVETGWRARILGWFGLSLWERIPTTQKEWKITPGL